jgi:hypothetical protein
MNALKTLVTSLGIFALGTVVMNAQGEMLQVKFEGSCRTTNVNGTIVKQPVNNKTLIKDFADAHSITNLNALALVYDSQGDERGDVIRIVSAKTGEILGDVLALFFSVDLTNAAGSVIEKEVSIFNNQQSFAIGSGMLKEQLLNKKGNPDHRTTGNLQYYLIPPASDGLKLCTASITTGKPFTPKSAPTNTVATVTRETLLLASNL